MHLQLNSVGKLFKYIPFSNSIWCCCAKKFSKGVITLHEKKSMSGGNFCVINKNKCLLFWLSTSKFPSQKRKNFDNRTCPMISIACPNVNIACLHHLCLHQRVRFGAKICACMTSWCKKLMQNFKKIDNVFCYFCWCNSL